MLAYICSTTLMSSEDMDIQPNSDNPGLFDVSIAALIDPYEVIQEDMISCEVTIPNTDFKVIVKADMFEYLGKKVVKSISTLFTNIDSGK